MTTQTDRKTGTFCECGYEFVIFPNGEDERDLAERVCALEGTKLKCIDCLEKVKHNATQ